MPTRAICTKCGANFQSDAKYCGFDGVELLVGEVEGEPLSVFVNARACPECNRQYPSYANYCGVDGTGLEDSSAASGSGNGDGSARGAGVSSGAGGAGETKHADDKAKSKGAAGKAAAAGAKGAGAGNKVAKKDLSESESAKEVKAEEVSATGTVASETLIGKVLHGKYRIESALAEGGMAVLYLAKHEDMERTVVVKVIHQSLMYRNDMIERFKRECKIAARLNHPNVVSVYDFGLINERQPYLVMEYIHGMSLSTMLTKQSRMALPVATRVMMQACSGLEEAHNCGIIHRDLKPDNILLQEKVDRPDWVKIVDFGIANLLDNSDQKKLTRTGVVIGTPEYMAPEQFTGKPLDVRTDIYALGVLMFEVLTNRVPFDSVAYDVLMAKHLMEEPPSLSEYRADIAEGAKIDQIVKKCLAKQPDERYQTVTELRKALETALQA